MTGDWIRMLRLGVLLPSVIRGSPGFGGVRRFGDAALTTVLVIIFVR